MTHYEYDPDPGDDHPSTAVQTHLLYERVADDDSMPLEQQVLLAAPPLLDPILLLLDAFASVTIKVVGYQQNTSIHLTRQQALVLSEALLAWQKRVLEHEEIARAARQQRQAAEARSETERLAEHARYLTEQLGWHEDEERGGYAYVVRTSPGSAKCCFETWPEAVAVLEQEYQRVQAASQAHIPF